MHTLFLIFCFSAAANIEYNMLYSSEIELINDAKPISFPWPVKETFIKTIIFTKNNQATLELTQNTNITSPGKGIVKNITKNIVTLSLISGTEIKTCTIANIKDVHIKENQLIEQGTIIGKSNSITVTLDSSINIQNFFNKTKNSKIKINKLTLI